MKLTNIVIKNYKSLKDISIDLDNLHALVGANSSGKSNLLRALDFLFNPSSKFVSEDTFWSKDTENEIRIEALFKDLTENEKEKLDPYLLPDGSFNIARYAKIGASPQNDDTEIVDSKVFIGQQYRKLVPKITWLQETNINASNISDWWSKKEDLTVGSHNFYEFLDSTSKPGVGDWKAKASQFVLTYKDGIEMDSSWIDNPKGYAGVLKGCLPCFVLVPAVKDVTDESKGTKSSPFGKLINHIISSVSDAKQKAIKEALSEISGHLNRVGADKRVPLIAQTEKELKKLLNDIFPECDLEIEFETPTLELLLSAPKLYIDDGLRNTVENKGHGLQRAVIFSILRQYADYNSIQSDGNKKSLIIAIEEPELYMHPQAQRTIRSVLKRIAQGSDQVLFSTHSSLLVDVTNFDEIVRFEIQVDEHKGERTNTSRIWQLSMKSLIEDLINRHPGINPTGDSMRELYANSYNTNRNEGFFASKIILVEGQTEAYCLPIYADYIEGCAFDPKGISVIECGGKGSMDRLYRIFNELHIPCYILIDYDFGNSNTNITDKSIELINLVGDKSQYQGSLYISDKIAYFPIKWETQLSGDIANYSALEGQACTALGISKDGSKPLIGRYIARWLVSQTPSQIPICIEQIIKKACGITWYASCLTK
jgi:predicted ATP-dependent endonuclease of OLD family